MSLPVLPTDVLQLIAGYVVRTSLDYEIGDLVWAQDCESIWHSGVVQHVELQTLYVYFIEWSGNWYEWISTSRCRELVGQMQLQPHFAENSFRIFGRLLSC
jgi:hypothetical protein